MKAKPRKLSKPILSDKIADALSLKSRGDIEDDQIFGTKPKTLTRDNFELSDNEEVTSSDFRKRNINLLSQINKKYEGSVVSRRQLEELDSSINSDSEDEIKDTSKSNSFSNSKNDESLKSNSEDLESDSETDSFNIANFKRQIEVDENSDEGASDANSDEGTSDQNSDEDESDQEGSDEGYDISQLAEPIKEDFEHVKKQNISQDAKKGLSVRNQLLVWEGLLEMRIHLQRCVNTANQMPMPDMNHSLQDDKEFVEETAVTKGNISAVLDRLLTLQNMLFNNFPETKSLSTKVNGKVAKQIKISSDDKSDEEIPSDTDNEEIPSDTEEDEPKEEATQKIKQDSQATRKRKLEDYENDLSTTHKAFKTFRDSVIQKWNDKTRLATATNIKNTPTNTILQQISYILSDKEKLIRRTQLKRSEYDILGYKNEIENNAEENETTKDRKHVDEYIPEIFDDSDFYHQLLRELIECKSSDISDPVQLSRQWIALQQMRSKMKRKVDTKATKGRKIKYVVHNQLVNYMAPVKNNKWTEESANELYSSLFGKMFENNNAGLNGVGDGFCLTK